MTQLEKHINEALENIIFNGCTIPSALLKNYFETACLYAKLEQHDRTVDILGLNVTEPKEHDQDIIGSGVNDTPYGC